MRKICFVVDVPDDVVLSELNELSDKVAEVLLAPYPAYEDRAKRRFGSRYTKVEVIADEALETIPWA